MKKLASSLVLALVVCVVTGALALASAKKESITFPQDIMVNGTLVKKGTYDVKFDETTKELTVLKGKAVVAKATGRVETRDGKARYSVVNSTEKDNKQVLESIVLAGDNKTIFVGDGKGSTQTAQ